MLGVFISYSRHDAAFVRRLHAALTAREYEVWVDWEDIPKAAEWRDEITNGVRSADGFVYVISPDSAASAVCTEELQHAVDERKRVIPVLHREPNGVPVPDPAAALNWVFLREQDDFDAGLTGLIEALETDLDHVRTHTRLGVEAARWQQAGRDRSLLLRGSDLAAGEEWLVAGAGRQPEATQLQREYLLASRRAATRRHRIVIGAVSVALVVSVALAITALVQRSTAIHERDLAYARQLDADAQAKYSMDPALSAISAEKSVTDPELSVLLALRAAQRQPDAQTEAILRAALAQSNILARYPIADGDGGDAVWSPDGRRLLLTSPGTGRGSWARIYTPGTQARPVSLPAPSIRGVSGWDARGDRVILGGGDPAVYDAVTGNLIRRLPIVALDTQLTGDGRRLVTIDRWGTGAVFDVATGRRLATFMPRFHVAASCMAVSPDDRYVAQCDPSSLTLSQKSTPSELDVWRVSTGRLVRSLRLPTWISSVAFSPDGRRFAFTLSDTLGGARLSSAALGRAEGAPGTFVYDTVGQGPPVKTFPGAASDVVFGPDAAQPTLAWATAGDGLVHVYQFYSGRDLELTGATDAVGVVRFDRSGADVLAAGDDGTIRVYDANTGGQPIETLAGHTAPVVSAAFGDGVEYVASSSEDGTARLWRGPQPVPAVQRDDAGSGDGGVPSVSFSPDGRRIFVAGSGGTLSAEGRILDARTLRTVATVTAPAGQVLAGGLYTPDGRRTVALTARRIGSQTVGAALVSFDATTGERLAAMTPGGDRELFDAALDRTGRRAVTLESDGVAEIWDTDSGRLLRTLKGARTAEGAAAFSPDGALLAVTHYPVLPAHPGVLSAFGRVTVQLWNARTGSLARTLTGPTLVPEIPGVALYAPLAVAFSPDGRLLALGGANSTVDVFDVRSGALRRSLSIAGESGGPYAASLAFAPDGRVLAAGGASGAYLWQLPGWHQLPVFQHVPTGEGAFVTPQNAVRVAFTNDSRTLLTLGGLIPTIEAWNVGEGLQVFKVSPLASGSMNPAGTELATAGAAGISVYRCGLCGTLRQLLMLGRHRVTRSLTPTERALYLNQG